ncbi:MAG TPA: hypothetical protein PK080_02610 [Hyphomonadaceae bacterium]|nr:hypothetical protein [Hyphomonadaceae bacterium]
MRLVGVVLALGMVQAAYAQPPAVPAEVQAVIDELAQAYGLTPLGDAMLRELEDDDSETIEVRVAPDKLTYIHIEGNEDTIDINLRAMAGEKEFVPELGSVLQIPPGNGDKVSVEVSMACSYVSCFYFAQAFVR